MGKRRNCTLINSIEFAKSRHLWVFFGYFCKNYPIFFSRIFVMRNKGRHLCFGRDRNLAAVSRSRERNCSLRLTHLCVDFSPKLVSHFLSLKIRNGLRNASKFYESWGCIYVAFLKKENRALEVSNPRLVNIYFSYYKLSRSWKARFLADN